MCAVVVRRPGADVAAGEIVDHVRGRLAAFKKPRHVVFVDALPVNANGKVQKDQVRAMAVAQIASGAG